MSFGTIIIIVVIIICFYLIYRFYQDRTPSLPVVAQVDLSKYQGTWYEIARFPNYFEEGCQEPKANYTLNSDGTVKVVNTCMVNEKLNQVTGIAIPRNSQIIPGTTILTPGRLQVSFGLPFYGNYDIIALDPNYQYAMVGTPDRNYLWFLSRKPELSAAAYEELMIHAQQLGFPIERLIRSN